jgi:molybdopterin molybdotransferase
MISVDEALDLIRRHKRSQATQTLALDQCLGRTLAAPIIARTTRPPVAVSAMDGYAVRLADAANVGSALKVIGEAPAGAPYQGSVNSGEAVRIFTGGEVPSGADHIVIQENVTRDANTITCLEPSPQRRFVRAAGMDFKQGDTLVEAGTKIGPMQLSIAAAANLAELEVSKRPRVGILANGNELKSPGSDLQRGEIINSNPIALAALIERWGGEAIDLGIAADSVASIQAFAQADSNIDIYVPVGGASVGDHDHMRAAFSGLGFEPIFQKVAVKPGKPTWFSQNGDKRVIGLPGNPASALVCAHLFLAPLLSDTAHEACMRAALAAPLPPNGPREQFLRAAATFSPEGQLLVVAAPNQDSSLLRPFLSCNALIRRRPKAAAAVLGEPVEVRLIGDLKR